MQLLEAKELDLKKTDSWGQLEMLTKDVLDKLEDPDWAVLGVKEDLVISVGREKG